jgi:SAM-dependent methyltransferase
MTKIPIERLDSSMWAPPWTRREHAARYKFASRFVKDKLVVDCACGDGTSSAIFGNTARIVYGFDISSEAIDQANDRGQSSNVVLRCATATALPVKSKSVEVFVSLETIEHISDDRSFLDEVVRVVQDDGLFICSSPDRDVHSPGNTLSDQPWTDFHVREYTASEFSDMLHERFGSVLFFGQNSESAMRTKLQCWIGRTISRQAVLRLNQLVKVTWLLTPKSERHDVVPTADRRHYEYLIAVCTNAIQSNA